MRDSTQGLVMWVMGITVVSAAFTGKYLSFVKPGMKWFLVASGLVMLGIAIWGYWQGRKDAIARLNAEENHSSADHHTHSAGGHHDHAHGHPAHGDHAHDDHGDHHHHLTSVAWVLVVPFAIMSVVTPPPLGAYSAERSSGSVAAKGKFSGGDWKYEMPALPEGDKVELGLEDFAMRAVFDKARSLDGRTVELTGFVSSIEEKPGWAITQMGMSCCAADAYSVKVVPRGDVQKFDNDTWIKVTGTWIDNGADPTADKFVLPEIQVESIQQTDAPENPYDTGK